MSKAVVFFAEGTEECEALLVVDPSAPGQGGGDRGVRVGQPDRHRQPQGHHHRRRPGRGTSTTPVWDLVVLPGGIPGTPQPGRQPPPSPARCRPWPPPSKKVAAICAAPSILASLGLLEGRKATAHAAFQDQLAGAEVLDQEVVVDGNITTSYGLGGAIPFGLELVRQLAGPDEGRPHPEGHRLQAQPAV